jgi:methylenetetrahydrofolate reductase (NADPH)
VGKAKLREAVTQRNRLGITISTISTLLNRHANGGRQTLSFEFFPPKDEAAELGLRETFAKLLTLSPDFVSVTYGAGGSNPERSISVVEHMATQVATIGHLTCVGATVAGTLEIIQRFEAAGVEAILALRGDAPKDNPDALAQGEFKQAVELVSLAHQRTSIEVGVAAFPEGHPESVDFDQDIRVLKLKQDAGATFGVTQLFYQTGDYTTMVRLAREAGVTMPLLPGLMPIANAKQVLRMASLSGAKVPETLLANLEEAKDEEEARSIGMSFTVEFGKELLAAGAPGLHIFCLNQVAAAEELARGVGLVA